MRRPAVPSQAVLAAVLLGGLAAGPVAAQDAPAEPPPAPAAAEPLPPPPPPTPTGAGAQPGQTSVVDTVVDNKQEGDTFPLHVSGSLTQNLGSATFVYAAPTAGAVDPSPRGFLPGPTFFTTAELSPSLVLGDFSFSISQALGFEWTQSDSTTYANQLEVSDTRLGVRYGGLRWDEAGLSLGLSAGYNVPISLSSRWFGSLGGVGAGGRLGWTWKDIGWSVFGGANVGANILVRELAGRGAPPTPYDDRLLGQTNTSTCLTRSGEAAYLACVGNGPLARWSSSLGTSWTTLNDSLTFAAELGVGQSYSNYIAPEDELTSENAVGGWVFSPFSSGTLSASWSPVEWFTLTGGTASSQPMFGPWLYSDATAHEDNFRIVRFPFWDFYSPYNNFSTMFVDTTFTL